MAVPSVRVCARVYKLQVEQLDGDLKESKRLVETAERRFSKRIDTKSKLVEELKEELTEKDRR